MTKMTELGMIIAERVATDGPVPFETYMNWALYEPQLGYYRSGKKRIGRDGDFYTSPTSTPLFGKLLARWVESALRDQGPAYWQIGRCHRYYVLELGPGTGALRRAIREELRRTAPDIFRNLDYEASDTDVVMEDGPDRACVISNELVDAFPVRRITMTGDGLREIHVDFQDDAFVEVLLPPTTPRLQAYLNYLGVELPRGFTTEINLRAVDWITREAQSKNASILTIDYGYESDELYAPYRAGGTMMGYYRHQYSEDVFAHIGEQDLTSHVNFSALMKYGEAAGLETALFTTQSDFLTGLGGLDLLESLQKKSVGDTAALKDYLAVKELLMPDGMGGVFKVLVQRKG